MNISELRDHMSEVHGWLNVDQADEPELTRLHDSDHEYAHIWLTGGKEHTHEEVTS